MKSVIVAIVWLTLVFAFGCTNEKVELCGGEDPVANLTWLEDRIQEYETAGIYWQTNVYQYTYRGQILFAFEVVYGEGYEAIICGTGTCGFGTNYNALYYNCQGEIVSKVDEDRLRNEKLLWEIAPREPEPYDEETTPTIGSR